MNKKWDVVFAGYIALKAAYDIAKAGPDEITKRFPEFITDEIFDYRNHLNMSTAKEKAIKVGGKCYMLSEGGLYEALWNISSELKCGFDIYLKQVPVRQATIELMVYKEEDPYRSPSEGGMIILCNRASEVIDELSQVNINAASIGFLRDDLDKRLIIDGRVQFLNKNYKERK